jgi:hypothetical protein
MQKVISRAQLEADRTKLMSQGIVIVGDHTQVSHDGVTLKFDYAEPSLTITTVKKPFYVSESEIESEINKWFASNV